MDWEASFTAGNMSYKHLWPNLIFCCCVILLIPMRNGTPTPCALSVLQSCCRSPLEAFQWSWYDYITCVLNPCWYISADYVSMVAGCWKHLGKWDKALQQGLIARDCCNCKTVVGSRHMKPAMINHTKISEYKNNRENMSKNQQQKRNKLHKNKHWWISH